MLSKRDTSITKISMCVKISGDGVEADCNFTVPTLTAWEGSDSLPVSSCLLFSTTAAYAQKLETSCGRSSKGRKVGGRREEGGTLY